MYQWFAYSHDGWTGVIICVIVSLVIGLIVGKRISKEGNE